MTGNGLSIAMLGNRPYDEVSEAQVELVELRQAGQIGDLLLVLEHPPTYTRGRRTEPQDLHHDPGWYRERGIEIFDTPRGGRVTYHGPGQLVAYPIIDLRGLGEQPGGSDRSDVAGFVAALEAAMVGAVARWQIPASTIEGLTGIWVGDDPIPPDANATSMSDAVSAGAVRKIGSIGLRISRGITSHGLSLNVNCDLEPFAGITSCGIDHCRVTSILAETDTSPSVDSVGSAVAEELAEAIGRDPMAIAPEELGLSARLIPNT